MPQGDAAPGPGLGWALACLGLLLAAALMGTRGGRRSNGDDDRHGDRRGNAYGDRRGNGQGDRHGKAPGLPPRLGALLRPLAGRG
ncbi:MAG TPA: hypothetical protein VKB17_06210 [Thermoleophilaceae bacterium]|nr:hypothetical protein [Thermoleophilaceae bacterium]